MILQKIVGYFFFTLSVTSAVVYYQAAKEPAPLPAPEKLEQAVGPDYCTPGLEDVERHSININETVYGLMLKYDLEVEDILTYNSNIQDINSIIAGGTICLPKKSE